MIQPFKNLHGEHKSVCAEPNPASVLGWGGDVGDSNDGNDRKWGWMGDGSDGHGDDGIRMRIMGEGW